jgi:hypothetical protein
VFEGSGTLRPALGPPRDAQIYVSILHCETGLAKADVLANRRFRNAIVAQRKLAEKYTQTLSDLMDGKGGKHWSQRSRALQHFQRTVGFDGGGVRVNINNQAAVVGSGNSFEKALERVKQMHAERQKQLDAVGVGSDGSSSEPI